MSETVQQGERKDSTLNLDKDVIALLGIVANKEDRSMKGEVTFLVKERAKQLGIKSKGGKA